MDLRKRKKKTRKGGIISERIEDRSRKLLSSSRSERGFSRGISYSSDIIVKGRFVDRATRTFERRNINKRCNIYIVKLLEISYLTRFNIYN